MKKYIFIILSTFISPSHAAPCDDANTAAIKAVTKKTVSVCKAEFGIKADYQALYSLSESVRSEGNKDYAGICATTCRPNDSPESCGNRFVAEFVEAGIKSLKENGAMEAVCEKHKAAVRR